MNVQAVDDLVNVNASLCGNRSGPPAGGQLLSKLHSDDAPSTGQKTEISVEDGGDNLSIICLVRDFVDDGSPACPVDTFVQAFAIRLFLHEAGLGSYGLDVPRCADSVRRLVEVADVDHSLADRSGDTVAQLQAGRQCLLGLTCNFTCADRDSLVAMLARRYGFGDWALGCHPKYLAVAAGEVALPVGLSMCPVEGTLFKK